MIIGKIFIFFLIFFSRNKKTFLKTFKVKLTARMRMIICLLRELALTEILCFAIIAICHCENKTDVNYNNEEFLSRIVMKKIQL